MANTNGTIKNTEAVMIDWHTHILPAMDDGSKNIEESAAMLRLCYEEGVRTVILTPHFYPHKENPDRFLRRRAKSFDKLLSYISETDENVKTPQDWPNLVLGAEVFFFPELAVMERKNLNALSIGDSNYLMVELPMETWGNDIYKAFESLIFNRGIKPILAHIDRYFGFIKDVEPLKELVREGMLIQLNTGAIEGFITRKKALKWIDAELVQILASDCHNISDRPPNLGKALAKLEKHIGRGSARKLVMFSPPKGQV